MSSEWIDVHKYIYLYKPSMYNKNGTLIIDEKLKTVRYNNNDMY